MKKHASCSSSSECRSERRNRDKHGHYSKNREGTEESEIQGPPAEPLPPVRPPARVSPQVCPVPALLPQAGAARRRCGSDEEQLVGIVVSCQSSVLSGTDMAEN